MRICTTNPGKLAEFGGLLAPLDIKLTTETDQDIPETGDTFAHNAEEKARGYAAVHPGEWLLAEDSGLVIPALAGLPGPYSARFADAKISILSIEIKDSGRPRSVMDPLNNQRVLEMMKDVPVHEHERGAYFVANIVVMAPDGTVAFSTERRSPGWIVTEPRGEGGFGYDPIFESDTSFGKTWAEIDSARKDLISHRSKAVWDLMAWLCSTNLEVK